MSVPNPIPTPSTTTREPYWDTVKGLLITLVVLGHCFFEYRQFPLLREATLAIYLFHMPAFLFVSGYFSRRTSSTSVPALARLGVLFLLLNFSMMVFAHAVHQQPYSSVALYYSSWYLLALLLYRASLHVCQRVPVAVLLPVSSVAALAVGYVSMLDNLWSLQKIIALAPFFLAGACWPAAQIERAISTLKQRPWLPWLLALASTAAVTVLLLNTSFGERDVLWESYRSHGAILKRAITGGLAVCLIAVLLALTPRRTVPYLTQWGRHSLTIYLTHRIVTLLLPLWAPQLGSTPLGIAQLLLASLLMLWVLGSHPLHHAAQWLLNRLTQLLFPPHQLKQASLLLMATVLVLGFANGTLATRDLKHTASQLSDALNHRGSQLRAMVFAAAPTLDKATLPPVLSTAQVQSLKEAVSLSFVGDLILLRDQVYQAYDHRTERYDFSPLFKYTAPILKQADLALGVLEGPLAGPDVEYSTSTLYDQIPLYLNFPDSFAEAVQAAGIDFVTTANNHVLDRGLAGARRTLDTLDRLGLDHGGSYRSEQDKADNHIRMLTVKGLNIAVLSYTYGSNFIPESYFFAPDTRHVTSVIVPPDSPHFAASKAAVLADFARAKALKPDTIVVLPHMGTQFSHDADAFQRVWADIFVDAGADVILSDHSHAVQPIEWRTHPVGTTTRRTLIVYCPGNYVNSFREQDGDAMAIVHTYLHPTTGEPIASGIVPMWGQARMHSQYRPLPIHQILHSPELQSQMSTHDLERVAQAHSTITSVMLGHALTLDQIQPIYYRFPEGYVRSPAAALDIPETLTHSRFYRLLQQASHATFIGDSITEGTKNGGYGWHEPLVSALPHLTVHTRAWGGFTSRMLLQRVADITDHDTDLYVIAVGTNDVRYRDPARSAMTAADYISHIDQLIQALKARNPAAEIVLIGAWTTDHHDPFTPLPEAERQALLREYRTALKDYAHRHHHEYLDPNPGIDAVLTTHYPRDYLTDHIHPNAFAGIRLYSTKVLEAAAAEN